MNLIAAMRKEFQRASAWLFRSLLVKAALVLAAIASLMWDTHRALTVILFVGAVVGQIFLFVCRWIAASHQDFATDLRLAALLEDGIGVAPSSIETARFLERAGLYPEEEDTTKYYSSTLPRGPARLVEDTAESAFFSESLSRRTSLLIITAALAVVAVLVIGLVVLVEAGIQQSTLQIAAKAIMLGILFWIADDLTHMALAYRASANRCARVLGNADAFLQGQGDEVGAFRILSDYHAVAAGTPPFPWFVYPRSRERLVRAWAAREKG